MRPAQSQDMHIPSETEIQKQHPTNKTQSVPLAGVLLGGGVPLGET